MTAPELVGLHHVTLPVSDLEASAAWYRKVLRGERVTRLDHHDAAGNPVALVLRLPGLSVPLKLQLLPEAAAALCGYDPVTFGVAGVPDLDRWVGHLDACGIAHSPVTPARIGHSVSLTDPDGTLLRLYTEPAGGLDQAPFTEALTQ